VNGRQTITFVTPAGCSSTWTPLKLREPTANAPVAVLHNLMPRKNPVNIVFNSIPLYTMKNSKLPKCGNLTDLSNTMEKTLAIGMSEKQAKNITGKVMMYLVQEILSR
jgi:hypothetical protein